MKRPRPRRSPGRNFLHLLWQVPVFAVPFALFFMITSGQPLSTFVQFYVVSFVFAGFILLGVWIAHDWLAPPFAARHADDPRLALKLSILHAGVALLFGAAAAITLHFTILPGFLGTGRSILTLIIYFVLFGMLAVGVALAANLQREALERAGSDRELQLARRIQQSFLLTDFPRHPRLDVHATNVSSKQVSGDFYDVVPLGEDGYLVAVADVSGKGVPAALLSSMLQASLRTQAPARIRVAAMMESINALVCQRAATGQFATFFLAAVNGRELTIRFTNAGHNFPILFRAGGERRTLETGGLVVGMREGATYEEECLPLAPGDRLVLYTDGVTEAARLDREMFGEERLMTLVESLPRELEAREIVDRILAGVLGFLGETEPDDDVTIMALRVLDSRHEP